MSPSLAHDLGQGAAGGGHEGDAAGHGLDGRQREALVERGDDRDLGLGVELDDAVVVDAAHELHRVLEAEALDGGGDDAALAGPADDHQLGRRSVRTLATASSSGTRPFMGTSALAVVMIRPGTRAMWGSGRKWVWSTPTGTTVIRSGAHAELGGRCRAWTTPTP